ncbi:hypothetical protein ACFORL_05140 [Legionella dresdenensis]|uniref:Dot/Icm T4SS effector n=1 Tax=Legionella dresdenensis TaxID=450200 RepID=A0ABV8CDY7_9GAMM
MRTYNLLYPHHSQELAIYLEIISNLTPEKLKYISDKARNLLEELTIASNPYTVLFTMVNLYIAQKGSDGVIMFYQSVNQAKWLIHVSKDIKHDLNLNIKKGEIEKQKRKFCVAEVIFAAIKNNPSLKQVCNDFSEQQLRKYAVYTGSINWNAISSAIEKSVRDQNCMPEEIIDPIPENQLENGSVIERDNMDYKSPDW